MVVSRFTHVTSGGLGQFVLSLGCIDGSNHYVDGCVPLDSSEPLFAVQQHGGEPSLAHLAVTVAFDIALATPHHGEHALDRIRRMQALAQQSGNLQPVEGQHFLERFEE